MNRSCSAKPTCRATITKSRRLALFHVASSATLPVRRDIATTARPRTSSESCLAAGAAVAGSRPTKAARRTTVSVFRPRADLAVGPALAVGRGVARVNARAEAGLAAGAAVGRRGAAESARGTTVAKSGAGAIELGRTAAGAVRRGAARASYWRWRSVAVAEAGLTGRIVQQKSD